MFNNLVGTSMGNELCPEGLLIQWFHGLRLAQSHVTIANGRWSMWHSQHSTRKSTEHHSVLHRVIRNCENLKLWTSFVTLAWSIFNFVILAERNRTSSHLLSPTLPLPPPTCYICALSLVPRPHPLMRRNSLVNQVEFLGLAGACIRRLYPSNVQNILRKTCSSTDTWMKMSKF